MRSTRILCLAIGIAAGIALLSAAALAEGIPLLPELAGQQPDLSLTTKAAELGGVVNVLQGCGPYTVFAPVDCAWANLCKPTAADLLSPCNKTTLASIVLYHAVCGMYTIADFEKTQCCPLVLKTINGGTLTIRFRDGCWYVNEARILGGGISAGNGNLFKIDRVLIPPGVRVEQKS